MQGFRERLDEAKEQYVDSLEQLVHERLLDPQGNRGSDILLIHQLKSRRPDVYGDKVTVTDDRSRDLLSILAGDKPAQVVDGTAREVPADVAETPGDS